MAAWIDGGTYLYADNTNKMRLTDAGSLNMSSDGAGSVPGATYIPMNVDPVGENFNVYDASTTALKPAMAVHRVLSTESASKEVMGGAAVFTTTQTNGCRNNVSGILSIIESKVTAINTSIAAGQNDSVGIQSRVIKQSDTVNNCFGAWLYVQRGVPGVATTSLKGSAVGAEINVYNKWPVTDAYRVRSAMAGVGGTYYWSRIPALVNNYPAAGYPTPTPWTAGLVINQADMTTSDTFGMGDAAINIAPETRSGLPCWANGILFSANRSVSNYGAIDNDYGVGINMFNAKPKYGIQFDQVGSGGAHIYSPTTTIIQRVGSANFTYAASGLFEAQYIRAEYQGVGGGSPKFATTSSPANALKFDLVYSGGVWYFDVYVDTTRIGRFNATTKIWS